MHQRRIGNTLAVTVVVAGLNGTWLLANGRVRLGPLSPHFCCGCTPGVGKLKSLQPRLELTPACKSSLSLFLDVKCQLHQPGKRA